MTSRPGIVFYRRAPIGAFSTVSQPQCFRLLIVSSRYPQVVSGVAIPIIKPARFLFAATAFALVCVDASADEPLYPTFERQKWELCAGVFGLTTQALVGSTRNGRPDFIIDLGNLGITESTSEPWVSLIAPLGSNWNVRLEYFTYSESGKVVATEDFEYDDLMVTTGAVVGSRLDVDLLIANYGYLWRTRDRGEIRFGVGLHMANLAYGVRATLFANDIIISDGAAREELLAPLPNLYFGGTYKLSPRFLTRLKFGWLDLTYDDWDGDLASGSVELEYLISDRYGLGLGFIDIDMDVSYEDSVGREIYKLEMQGPLLYFRAAF